MKLGRVLVFLFFFVVFSIQDRGAYALIVINEFLPDPPAGILGDANQDGTRSSADDEFVELLNWGSSEISLSGWYINDSALTRHIFDNGSILLPHESTVIFGGGVPTGFDVSVVTASSGSLSLNNTADAIQLFDVNGTLIDAVWYGVEGNQDQSLSRFPDGSGDFQLHSSIADSAGALYSPGRKTSGRPFSSPVIPEPSSCALFGLGFVWQLVKKSRRRGR